MNLKFEVLMRKNVESLEGNPESKLAKTTQLIISLTILLSPLYLRE